MAPSNGSTIPAGLQDLYFLVRGLNGRRADVLDQVCAIFPGLTKAELTGKSRKGEVSRPRQLAMYVLRNCYGMGLEEIGRAFGRDHTSVIYAVNKIRGAIVKSGADIGLFRTVDLPEEAVDVSRPELADSILDVRNSLYRLGNVRVFPSVRASLTYWTDLRSDHGIVVRNGPPVDITSKTIMPSPLAAGFYFHNEVTFDSEDERRGDAPILGTPHSLTLQEALELEKTQSPQ